MPARHSTPTRSVGHAARDEVVPRLAGGRAHDDVVAAVVDRDAPREDADDRAVDTGVGDDDVAAARQQQRGRVRRRPDELRLGRRVHEGARRPAEAQRREGREVHGVGR